MKYLPDTNVLSEEWLQLHAEECALSVLVLGELACGVEALPAGKRKGELEKRLRFLQEDYADRILPVDAAVIWEWSRYRARVAGGSQLALMDTLIAATALAWGLTVVTRNQADFPAIPQINPFSS